ncbi:hypothetical protein Hypma_001564 [Hypsizygus marmoreus]|uniref:Uncharacterized protein n=1 Tax=Hypsizygus marmoreus TaxID=39966 RepID=A0A369K0D9_HYPMA|nr:hypothetical protein Hypma_001564 [Hypsizygus marmoreus]
MYYEDEILTSTDEFFLKGQQVIAQERIDHAAFQNRREEDTIAAEEEGLNVDCNIELLEGKLKWESLKKDLPEYLNRK